MADQLDEGLAQLGRRDPFPVDWQQYGRALVTRLARAEAARRRRTWMVAAGSALVGAAAMLALAVALRILEPPGSPTGPVPPGLPPAGPGPIAQRPAGEEPRAPARPGVAEPGPFVRVFRCADGRMAEMRFEGFSPPGAQGGSAIVAVAGVRRTKRTWLRE